MINPGILKEKITIIRLSGGTRDDYGEYTELWIDYLTLKAAVKFNGGAKVVENFETFNTKSVTFQTYVRKIDESMRVIWKNETYIINSAPVIEYSDMFITCEKLKNN